MQRYVLSQLHNRTLPDIFRIFVVHFRISLLKKIDKLIVISFIGPAVLSYFVATFVLVMQFLWKYIDEILGKGLSILEVSELIFYYAITLIPMAVPITVLISSVMVFGDMAEKYELSSMKSAGISLLRIMAPSICIAAFIGLFSIFSANYLKPASLLQFNKRFLAIRKQKSALAIEEGIFNNAFNETIIRVNRIDKDKRRIHDVLIYDHTPNDKSLISVTSAGGGEMYTAEDGKYFVMKLDSGVQYREMEKKFKLGSNKSEIPFMRTYFDQWTKTFDMSVFDTEEGLLNFNRNREDMLNTWQLLRSIDTFRTSIDQSNQKTRARVDVLFSGNPMITTSSNTLQSVPPIVQSDSLEIKADSTLNSRSETAFGQENDQYMPKDEDSLRKVKDSLVRTYGMKGVMNRLKVPEAPSEEQALPAAQPKPPKKIIRQKDDASSRTYRNFAETIDSIHYREVLARAQGDLSRDRDELLAASNINHDNKRSYEKYMLRLNQQYSWAVICVIFLFIGAPLGSIIRKGGYGYPLLVAILFYMIFIISTIFGEKLVKNEGITGIQAAWLPCIILSPWAVLLTMMALRDVKFNPAAITAFFTPLIRRIRSS
jgi:lipopolysaccharide export system permease protein